MLHARHVLGAILGPPLLQAGRNLAVERHFAAFDADRDVARIDRPVVGEVVVHVLTDAVVGAGVVRGAASRMVPLPPPRGILVPEPAHDFVARAVPPVAAVALAIAAARALAVTCIIAGKAIGRAARAVFAISAVTRVAARIGAGRHGEVAPALVFGSEAVEAIAGLVEAGGAVIVLAGRPVVALATGIAAAALAVAGAAVPPCLVIVLALAVAAAVGLAHLRTVAFFGLFALARELFFLLAPVAVIAVAPVLIASASVVSVAVGHGRLLS